MSIDVKAPPIKKGHGSPERPLADDLWGRDPLAASPVLADHGNCLPDHRQVDFRRYYDPDIMAAEVARLWPRTWLFAGREEDIPNVGDRAPLQVGPLSFFIARSGPDEIKAFYNACLHRGTSLCSKPGSGASIRCPYHGWEWNIDGTLRRIPSHWDFPEIKRNEGSLPEVRVGRWGGFVFINADPNAPAFEDAIQVIPEHFKDFEPEKRYTKIRFRKLVSANWKICQEAFLEGYHLYGTHPGAVPFYGDTQSQYELWASDAGQVGRNSTPGIVPSMHAGPEANVFEAAKAFTGFVRDWLYPGAPLPDLDPEGDLRAQAGGWMRERIEEVCGYKLRTANAVMTDTLLYYIFPHFCFWMSEAMPWTYQFTPHPTDPQKSYFEVRYLERVPAGKERPPSAPCVEIGEHELIADHVPGIVFSAAVWEEDMSNMPRVQRGVRAAQPGHAHSQLARYQEILVQHWNQTIDRFLAKP